MIGYHFTRETLRDGRPIPPIGNWLVHEGPIVVCESGLHASKHPFDALQYAPGFYLHKVELIGELKSHGDPIDKYVGRKRRIIASLDCEWLLRYFARQQALSMAHLWDASDVVLEYLVTGDETIRNAARDAAWAAARDAAWAAARDAAWAAARDAAWAAARDARNAAWGDFGALVKQAFKEEANGQAQR